MATKCNLASWMGSWNQKRTYSKLQGKLNRLWALAGNNVQYCLINRDKCAMLMEDITNILQKENTYG